MAETTEIAAVRARLRIVSTGFDDEIGALIDDAEADLQGSGITYEDDDPMILETIVLHCKSRFGLSPEDGEMYETLYRDRLQKLSLMTTYRESDD